MLLVGCGPLPAPGVARLGFPQLRLAHFKEALAGEGHAVRVALLSGAGELGTPADARRWEGIFRVEEEGPGWLEALSRLAEGAELIVSAGPYNPGLAAAAVAGGLPWWADVPGDPFAELQALAIAGAGEPAEDEAPFPERVAATQRAALAVLGRADAFSAVSGPQRHALIGQLGLAGRLVDAGGRGALAGEERVHVLPVAWSFGLPEQPARRRAAEDPLVVGLVGGFNAWLDVETLVEGLDRALARAPRLRVLATGGGIARHHAAAWERFSAWAARPGVRERVRLEGWVPVERLPALLSEVHVGLCLDAPGYEAELGSRTRLLFFAHQGVLGLGTTRCELARELAELGALRRVPMRDPAALAEALAELAATPLDGLALEAARQELRARHAPERVARPLLAWVARPSRLTPGRAIAAALIEENLRMKAELAAVYASPTWRALSRVTRPLSRRRG